MTRKMNRSKRQERADIRRMTREIRSGANYSLAVLGMGAVYRISGRFLNIRAGAARR
jgi:hypothetical protein